MGFLSHPRLSGDLEGGKNVGRPFRACEAGRYKKDCQRVNALTVLFCSTPGGLSTSFRQDIETTTLVYGKINSVMQVEVNEKIDTLLKRLS